VWRGAALLADYLLELESEALCGCTALELGAGPGLPSMLLARNARCVFATDIGIENLNNCAANVALNNVGHVVKVRHLDWFAPLATFSGEGSKSTAVLNDFAWKEGDVEQLHLLDLVIAADCMYDNDATEAFMKAALRLLLLAQAGRPTENADADGKDHSLRFIVSLEKRVCFTMRDMDVRAPAYDFWRTLFLPKGSALLDSGGAEHTARLTGTEGLVREGGAVLIGHQVEIASIPQRVRPYERSEYLELWELRAVPIDGLGDLANSTP